MLSKMPQSGAILLGLGSIGRVHLKELIRHFDNILIVDPKAETLDVSSFKMSSNSIKLLSSLSEFEFQFLPRFAVIANWGPDHFESFISLVNVGVKNFIIEKPLVDCFADLYQLRRVVVEKKLNVVINHQNSFSYLGDLIQKLDDDFQIGKAKSISVLGGAKCIATNGIHYLALASIIFGKRPIYTQSRLYWDLINPRSPDLGFIAGVASWEFANQSFLTLSFSNLSQVDSRIEILFEHALVIVEGSKLELKEIPSDIKKTLTKPTRTGSASEQIYFGEAYQFPSGQTGIDRIYSFALGNEDSTGVFDHGFGATEDLLSTFVANAEGRGIALPLTSETLNKHISRKWNIS